MSDDEGDELAARKLRALGRHVSAPAHPLYDQLRREQQAAVDRNANPVARRAHGLAAALRYCGDAIESGAAGEQGLLEQMTEQIDDAWAAFHRTPSDDRGPRLKGEFDNLVRIGITSAVEAGADWLKTAREMEEPPAAALRIAVGKAVEMAEWNYPEYIRRANQDLLGLAIRAWARGAGKPQADEPRGSKWEYVATLCRSAGVGEADPETIRSAWEKRRPR